MLIKYRKCELLGVDFILMLFSVLSQLKYVGSTNSFDHLTKFLILPGQERTAIDKFRPFVRPYLKNFIKDDINPLRRLLPKNLEDAQQLLIENLGRWRRHHSIDTILNHDYDEDFSDLRKEYPLIMDAHDKQGRPIGSLPIGHWNLRRAVFTGKLPRLIRYMTNLLERNRNIVLESMSKGGNVTQFKIIANMDGYNPFQQGCPLCMLAYTSFLRTMQNRYPGYMNQFVIVNTPPTFKAALDAMQPLLSPRFRRTLKVFGRNKAEWMEYLQKDISKDELARVI